MNAQDFFAPLYIRLFNRNLAVKAARTEQSRVKNVCAVCCRKNDEAFFVFKTVHFYKELV